MSGAKSTKNLGQRRYVNLRLGPHTDEQLAEMASLIGAPQNAVVNCAIFLMLAQFAPLLARKGLSLDILEEELRALFDEARRVIDTTPAPSRKKLESKADLGSG